VVDAHGYPFFFGYVSALGIPAVLAVLYLLVADMKASKTEAT